MLSAASAGALLVLRSQKTHKLLCVRSSVVTMKQQLQQQRFGPAHTRSRRATTGSTTPTPTPPGRAPSATSAAATGTAAPQKLILLDGHNLAFRSFWALAKGPSSALQVRAAGTCS